MVCQLLCLSGLLLAGDLLLQVSSEEIFTAIYENGLWGKVNQEGISGVGSSLKSAKPYMNFLEHFLKENKITSVLDLGCGDWSFSQHINWENIDYLGVDVVQSVIAKNQEKFSKENIFFLHTDALQTDLPPADLLVCKDVLQHLSNEAISHVLSQLSKYKHCLITNDIDPYTFTKENIPLGPDFYHTVDLTKAPFFCKGEKVLTYYDGYTVKQVIYIKNVTD